MTIEKAIEILRKNRPTSDPRPCGMELCDAVDMAISALRQQECVCEANKALTLDELRKMDAPVWLRCYQVDGDGYWCLCKNGIIITPAGNRYDVSEIPHWAFYRQKPEEGTV